MSDLIFALPRHAYASYRDYYRLIELSGFQTCFIDEIDQSSNNTYIVTIYNGEFGDYSRSRARIVLTDLEYHVGENALPPLPNVEIWACDKWYAEQIGAKYWPMGSHKGLFVKRATHLLNFDVAYLGFIQGLYRREAIRQQLIERGVEVSPMVAWGDERDAVLRASKVYLHVHQHAHIPAVPPLRMVVAAAYNLPVISETCADAGMFGGFSAPMMEVPYTQLANQIAFSCSTQHDFLAIMGQALHQHLCVDYTFRHSVETAL